MKTLEQLRAELREKLAALQALKTKVFSAEKTAEDEEAFEKALDAVEAVEKEINRMERAERVEALSSKLADAPVAVIGHNSVPAQAKDAKPEEILSICAAATVIAQGKKQNPLKVLEAEGYAGLVQDMAKAMPGIQEKGLNTLVSAEGGILVPATVVGGGIVPLLRVQSSFLQSNPTRVELINGGFKQARGASGASASYIAEGALKPISAPSFDSIDMRAKKLAGIVVLTEEAQRWTIGNLSAYVQDDLRQAMALTLDLNAWLGTGAGASPTGILNKTGVQTYTPTFAGATAPTLAELDAMVTGMILKLVTNNLFANNRWRWVMSYRTAMRLADIRTADGELAFPGMQGAGVDGGLNFKGIPVVITAQIPTNGGATTDETTIALVDFTHVLYGEEMAINVRMSNEATLTPNGTDLIHLWQSNQFAILAESMHDFGLRFAKAVVKATIRF